MRFVTILIGLIFGVNAGEILILSSVISISHSRWYDKLALLLANNGHKVAVLDTDKHFYEHPNITHFMMDIGFHWMQVFEKEVADHPDGLGSLAESDSIWENLLRIADPTFLVCDLLLRAEGTTKFMEQYKNHRFDVIIGDTFCESFYGFVNFFNNPPLIVATPYLDVMESYYAGLFDNPSYVPFHLTSYSPYMNVYERAVNTFYTLMGLYVIKNYNVKLNDELIRDVFGNSAPGLETILRNNMAIIMTGYSSVLQGAKPLPPNYIPIPGFHATPPDPLPKDIQKFLDEAKDGAILFSMGSNFKSILMSPEKREMFLSVFKEIPQRVIWKLELDNATNIPANVMIKKWLPQSDILGHPNVKAFISHGGLLGTQEAVYHGVPVLGLPLMFDQIHNMDRLERHGVGIRLHYKRLDKEYIAKQINQILNNLSYQKNMKELSAAFRDTPRTPQETAIFWIEYVIRHSKTTKNYLKSSSVDLYWYQRLLLDVAAFVALCCTVAYIIVKRILTCILYLIRGSKNKSRVNSQKKKQ